jgi:hypothetical protein
MCALHYCNCILRVRGCCGSCDGWYGHYRPEGNWSRYRNHRIDSLRNFYCRYSCLHNSPKQSSGKNIPAIVPPALIKAGLPVSSVAAWLSANTVGTPMAFASVKGNNPAIMAAGVHAFKMASAQAYRTVFLTTLAFWGVGLGLTFFTPNADPHMTSNVATTLHKRNDTEIVALKEVDNTAEA